MRMRVIVAAAAAVWLSGCTVQTKLVPTDGSRADGIVEMGYQLGGFNKAVIDWPKADAAAAQRCAAWGYSNEAQRFEGSESVCTWPGTYVCNEYKVTVRYQCVGKPEATAAPAAAKAIELTHQPSCATSEGCG